MPRMVDARCPECEFEIRDVFAPIVPDAIVHATDSGELHRMEQLWFQRPKTAQWGDRDAVVVYRKPDGSISYPGRNDRPTPKGCERVELRSLREVERFEKQHGVRSEIAWYDKGSGAGFDDERKPQGPSEEQRYRKFLDAMR